MLGRFFLLLFSVREPATIGDLTEQFQPESGMEQTLISGLSPVHWKVDNRTIRSYTGY